MFWLWGSDDEGGANGLLIDRVVASAREHLGSDCSLFMEKCVGDVVLLHCISFLFNFESMQERISSLVAS
jgi:hypothetical protein